MMVVALSQVWSGTRFETARACATPRAPSPSPFRQNGVAPTQQGPRLTFKARIAPMAIIDMTVVSR
jgi:hypothetical protein